MAISSRRERGYKNGALQLITQQMFVSLLSDLDLVASYK